MVSVLTSNSRISANFENIHLNFSTHAYIEVRFRTMVPKYENSKNIFL